MNRMLFQHSKYASGVVLLTILLGVMGVGATIAQLVFLSKVVNSVFLAHGTLVQVGPLLFLLLGLIIVRAALTWLREVTTQQAAIRVKSALRLRLFAHLLQLGPGYSKSESTGELVATASEGIERLDAYVSRYLPQIALSVLVPLMIAAYIFPIDWISAALLLVTAPIIPLLMFLVARVITHERLVS